jgi:excisionase family DNA binding protein
MLLNTDHPPLQLPRMLTPREIAPALAISESQVRRLLASGEIPGGRRIGTLWRLAESDLRKIVAPAP